jgi:endoglucanase
MKTIRIVILLSYCVSVFLSACSNSDETADIELVSTVPAENSVIPVATEYVTFVFSKGISIADKAKITLNGISVPDALTYNETYMRIKIASLKSETDYTVLVDKGAIKAGSGKLNKDAFSLKFKTMDAPSIGGSVSQHGFLSVNGTSLVNKDGKEIVLHGVSFGWHNWWPRFFNENTVTWLKNDWKCDVVRAAIGVDPNPDGYLYKPEASLACLYAVVDAAIKNDMYVIIDWHSHKIYQNEAKGFFQLVAEKYKDYPNIIYEIFNEPEGVGWSSVKTYSEAVIETIRAIDKKNIILVGVPNWSQDVDVAANNPITGYNNLMYVLHFYAATHGQYLRDKANTALGKGLPVFVSECAGMEASGDGAINKQAWQAWLQWMNDRNLSWTAWSVTDKNETCSMIQNTSSPVSGWKDSDLKEWGKIVREELRKYK